MRYIIHNFSLVLFLCFLSISLIKINGQNRVCVSGYAGTFGESTCNGSNIAWNPCCTANTLGAPDGVGAVIQPDKSVPESPNCTQFTDFGFSIPNNAVIEGIELITYRCSNGGYILDEAVHLIHPVGGLSATNHAVTDRRWHNWRNDEMPFAYNRENDLWGETWTAADINDPAFGAHLEFDDFDASTSGIRNIYIDAVEIKVCYRLCDDNNVIGGSVYRDYEADGTWNDLEEAGVPNITVTAIDAGGTTYTTTTNPNGSYILSVPNGTQVRLEFTGIPSYLHPTQYGTDHNTTVQFLTSPNCSANLGLSQPADYAQDPAELYMVSTIFNPGEYSGSLGGNTAIASFTHDGGANSGTVADDYDDPAKQPLATHGEVGGIWGLAWDRTRSVLYASAAQKYAADFGPEGPGAIYQIPVDCETGMATGTATLLIDIPNVCADIHGVDLDLVPGYDQAIFDATGKCSLGDIDIDANDQMLYTVNLNTQEVIQIDIANQQVTNSWAFPDPGDCTGNYSDIRPFGLKWQDGLLYVGAVCTGQSTRTAGTPEGDQDILKGYVYSLEPSSNAWSPVLDIPMNPIDYPRQESAQNLKREWHPWATNYDDIVTMFFNDGYDATQRYATPWITDIEFDGNDMIIGIRDRTADQWGWDMPRPDGGPMPLKSVVSSGDILRACWNVDSLKYFVESAGKCGCRTAAKMGFSSGPGAVYVVPRGGEFYYNDGYIFHENSDPEWTNVPTGHDENSLGGLYQVKRSDWMAYSALNPQDAFDGSNYVVAGGIQWNSNINGDAIKSYHVYEGGFSKSNGMGDLEALSKPQPLEIGNRVWIDTNEDGIQDPDEVGIPGINIHLYLPDGTLVGTTTTAADGSYYFNNSNVNMNGATELLSETDYLIVIDPAQVDLLSGTLPYGGQPHRLTTNDTGMGPINDINDTDGTLASGFSGGLSGINNAPYISITTQRAGENNHSYDFGFAPANDPCTNPQCANIPEYFVCTDGSDVVNLDVDSNAMNYEWFDGTGNSLGTGATLSITNSDIGDGTAGQSQCFYYTATNSNSCDGYTCCPVIITVEDCCPTENCLQIQVIEN